LDKSLTRFTEHAKDNRELARIRENLRRYFNKEFERMRSFNEQFYEKYGGLISRRRGFNDGEEAVRNFVKNFRRLLQRQRSKRLSDRSARESSSTLTKKRTENGETTITDGRGDPTTGSGPFHVKS
uniref:Inhibitor_I29 domain-containing protein n=1 Tax=Haemonchus placei TaxID=6290 RepID=A0A0N4WWU6_HAEPC